MLHPEQAPHEIYMGNCTESEFSNIGWKTKRQGYVAYDINGVQIPNSVTRPAFVRAGEMREAGMEVDPQYVLGRKPESK